MMTEKTGNSSQSASAAEWMNKMTDFWSPIMETWAAGMPSASQPAEASQHDSADALQGFVQMWQTMLKHADTSGGMEHLKETSQVVPDMLMGFAQTCLRGFTRFQEQVNQWMADKDSTVFMKDSDSFNRMFLQGWTEVYEKEFSQFLKMPQIGLGRVYQERVLQAADKYNLFQVAYSKFIQQLFVPMEEAFEKLQQQVSDDAKDEAVEEDPRAYYSQWIKLLEGCYMKLFKQPAFSQILGDTLGALNDYSSAKQAVVNDMLKQNAIPTHEDLDELYKEIYLLKKRMRIYEKS